MNYSEIQTRFADVPRCVWRLWIVFWNIYCEIINKNIYTNNFLFLVFVVPSKNEFVTFENRTDDLSHFWLGITSVISS
jgi:hypothetical protein